MFAVHRFAQGAADWRSGQRWSILSMLCPVHPFPLRGTSPRWEACHWIFRSLRSLTNPVPLPPQGKTRKYVTLDIVSHMTPEANPVTLLASPLGEEGHEVAKGVQANWIHRGAPRPANPVRRHPAKSVWTVVILIMILDVDVTAEGGIIKLIAHRAIHNPRPEGPLPPERSEHNLPPLGGHNPRAGGPSTLTPKVCPKPEPRPFL